MKNEKNWMAGWLDGWMVGKRHAVFPILQSIEPFMHHSIGPILAFFIAFAAPNFIFGQAAFPAMGAERSISGGLPGDQTMPGLSLSSAGGFLVWQDNSLYTDGRSCIAALALDHNFVQIGAPFRVNQILDDRQENAQISLLNGGGAMFAWQGGPAGRQNIYARFLSPSNTWLAGDVMVNSYTNGFRKTPAAATLSNGNVIVVWTSFNQQSPTSMLDVWGRLFSPSGQKLSPEFLINQFTPYNQRMPVVAPLSSGGFVVVWISEQERNLVLPGTDPYSAAYTNSAIALSGLPSVDVYARLFDANCAALGSEFRVNASMNTCTTPAVAASADGGFLVGWTEQTPTNSLDVFARAFSSAGIAAAVQPVNTHVVGDQFAPKISSHGADYLVVWTSLAQDGSGKGVFGQVLQADGSRKGGEFRVNTTVVHDQMVPTVDSDGVGRFLAVWSSYVGGRNSFDLMAQAYADPAYTPVGGATNGYAPPAFDPFPAVVITLPSPGGSGSGGSIQPASGLPVLEGFPFTGPMAQSNSSGASAFKLAAGTYNGLFSDKANGVLAVSSGSVSLKTTAKGQYSGKIVFGSRSYTISGSFNPITGWVVKTNPIPLFGGGSLSVAIQLDLTGGSKIFGTVSDGHWVSELEANRAFTQNAARYTMIITPNTNLPSGPGYGSVIVTHSGTVQWSATLADGMKVTQSSTISKEGFWPLYVPLYGPSARGFVMSWIQFINDLGSGTDLNGQMVWTKPANSTPKYYPGGFTNEFLGEGWIYTKPSPGMPLVSFSNGNLVLSGGGLGQLTLAVKLDHNRLVAADPVANKTNKLTLSLTPASGLFQGSALNPANRQPIKFQGVLFDGRTNGAGMFLGNNQQSGEVDLLGTQP